MLNLNITAKDIENIASDAINSSIVKMNKILTMKLNTKENNEMFINLLIQDFNDYSNLHSYLGFFQYYSNDKNIIQQSIQADKELTKYTFKVYTNVQLYRKLIEYFNNNTTTVHLKFVSKLIHKFKLCGIDLNEQSKNDLNKINKEINSLENELKNIDHTDIDIPSDNLNNFLKEHFKNNLNNNKYYIKLTKQNYNLCMKYIKDCNIRKRIEYAYVDNYSKHIMSITKLIILRNQKAKILGFESHTDLVLSDMMFKNKKKVNDFLNDIMQRVDYRYYKEMDTLLKLKNNTGINTDDNIYSWDLLYYTNKWKLSYGINDNDIKNYFNKNNTINKIINIYENLFNIKFIKNNNYYEIKEHTKTVAYLIIDLNHHSNTLRTYCISYNKIPSIALLGNYNDLLFYQEVVNIFHEFAHIMHIIFGNTDYVIFNGYNAEEDFIEIPGYIMELFCIENYLHDISSHVITHNKLDIAVINKIKKLKLIDIGINYKKNIMLSQYDMLIHSNDNFIKMCIEILSNKENYDIKKVYINLFKKLTDTIMKYEGYTDNKYKLLYNNNLIFPMEIIDIIVFDAGSYYKHVSDKIIAAELYYYKKDCNNAFIEFKNKVLKHGGSKDANLLLLDYAGDNLNNTGFTKIYKIDEDDDNISVFLNTEKINKNTIINKNNNNFSEINETELLF